MDYAKASLEKHYAWRGKLEMISRAPADSAEALSLAYTPGVAAPCLEIQRDPDKSYELTRRWNTVAVVTDGSAVLGRKTVDFAYLFSVRLADRAVRAGKVLREGEDEPSSY